MEIPSGLHGFAFDEFRGDFQADGSAEPVGDRPVQQPRRLITEGTGIDPDRGQRRIEAFRKRQVAESDDGEILPDLQRGRYGDGALH